MAQLLRSRHSLNDRRNLRANDRIGPVPVQLVAPPATQACGGSLAFGATAAQPQTMLSEDAVHDPGPAATCVRAQSTAKILRARPTGTALSWAVRQFEHVEREKAAAG